MSNPPVVFFAVVEMTLFTVGPGSVTVTPVARPCLIMNTLGPARTPTSILSVTGTIQTALKCTDVLAVLRARQCGGRGTEMIGQDVIGHLGRNGDVAGAAGVGEGKGGHEVTPDFIASPNVDKRSAADFL